MADKSVFLSSRFELHSEKSNWCFGNATMNCLNISNFFQVFFPHFCFLQNCSVHPDTKLQAALAALKVHT